MVIPEEVELLILMIRAQEKSKVHIMTYAAPVTKNMLHFNALSYYVIPLLPVNYAVPDWLSVELGVLAGRLYMSFEECTAVKRYLGLADDFNAESSQSSSSEHVDVSATNRANFLLDWLTIRRKGQDITHTSMGYICQGRPLHQSHPFFATRIADADGVMMSTAGGQRTGGNLEEAEDEDTDLEEDEWDPISQAKSSLNEAEA